MTWMAATFPAVTLGCVNTSLFLTLAAHLRIRDVIEIEHVLRLQVAAMLDAPCQPAAVDDILPALHKLGLEHDAQALQSFVASSRRSAMAALSVAARTGSHGDFQRCMQHARDLGGTVASLQVWRATESNSCINASRRDSCRR